MKKLICLLISYLFINSAICQAGVNLNGDSDYLSPSSSIVISGAFTACGRVKASTWANNGMIIGRTNNTDFKQNYYLNLKTLSNRFQIGFYDSTGSAYRELQTTSITLSTGTIYTVCGSWNTSDSKLRIYVNGSLNNTSAAFSGATPNNAGSMCIGGGNGCATAGNYFAGEIYDVALWSSTLTDYEIEKWSNSYIKRMCIMISPSTLEGCWTLDSQPDGSTLNSKTFRDISNAGITLTGVDGNGNSTTTAEAIASYQ